MPLTPRLLRHRLGSAFGAVLLAALLGACSDGGMPPAAPLQAPQAVRLDASACPVQATAVSTPTLIQHVWHDGVCTRQFTGIAASVETRRLPLATTGSTATAAARITVDELFDWAQVQYRNFFPSSRTTLKLGPYQYRYYPESQNHVAVADGVIYVQGPISGGDIARVGTVAEFECLVNPVLCGTGDGACIAPSDWQLGDSRCTASSNGGIRLESGQRITLVDSGRPTVGSAEYLCTAGQLSPTRTPICATVTDAPCDTSAVSWNESGNTCNAQPTDPRTLSSGQQFTFTDSTGTTGTTTLQCNNGDLTRVGSAVCRPAPGPVCNIPLREWKVDNFFCEADVYQTQMASGSVLTFNDTQGQPTGSISYFCDNGNLVVTGTPTCSSPLPQIQDSFGGPGGSADGSANGDGTAADGAPIVGGTVTVIDRNGKTVFAPNPTDARGYFRVKLDGMVPPLVVKVRRPDGVVRHSLSTQALRVNGYIFMAVTGLTDWIAADVAERAVGVRSAGVLTGAMIAANPSAVPAAVQASLNNPFVAEQLAALGIAAETFNPLSAPFRPDRTGYDALLDNLIFTVTEAGVPVIRPTYCLTPTSWSVQITGTQLVITCTPDPNTPTRIENQTTLIVRDSVGPTTGTVGFTCLAGVVQAPVLPSCQQIGLIGTVVPPGGPTAMPPRTPSAPARPISPPAEATSSTAGPR
jgi:hypothetical protein